MILAQTTNMVGLCVFLERIGLSLRLGLEPATPKQEARLSWMAVYDAPGKEGVELKEKRIEFPPKSEPNVNEAAGLLYELLTRTPTPED